MKIFTVISLKMSLKTVLLYTADKNPSIPVAHAVGIKLVTHLWHPKSCWSSSWPAKWH